MNDAKLNYRLHLALAVVAFWATSSGCVAMRNCHTHCANRVRAHLAFGECACPPECISSMCDYRKGWKDGYYEVATGGEGCAPPLPPECYWTPKYECQEGQYAIQTWYRGYQDGAHAAIADGVQQYNYIPSPHTAIDSHHSYDDQYDHASESVPMPEMQADELPTPDESASQLQERAAAPVVRLTAATSPVLNVTAPAPQISLPLAVAPAANPLRVVRPNLTDTAADIR